MKKKALAVILSVLMIMACLPFAISAKTTDFTDYTAITDVAGLKAIINDMAGKYYLANNIAVTGNWTPIGWTDADDAEFTGTFDGNGMTISGPNLDSPNSTNIGLFAIIGKDGTVQNLDIDMNDFGGYANVGAIAGINNGTIADCTVKADEIGAYGSDGTTYGNAGGIAGSNKGTIIGCATDVYNAFGYYFVGGIAGSNFGTISQCKVTGQANADFTANSSARGYAGGIAGRTNGTISDCIVKDGDVRGTKYIGTIAGRQYEGGVIKNIVTDNNLLTWVANNSQYYSFGVGYITDAKLISETIAITNTGNLPKQSNGLTSAGLKSEVNDYITENFDSAIWRIVNGNPELIRLIECDAENHIWDNGTVTTPASCKAEGVMTYVCTICGETKTEVIAKADHTIVIDEAVAPTCVDEGLTEGSHCSVCDEVIVAQVAIDALGHDFGDWTVTKEATLTEKGEETRYCSRCDATETRETAFAPSADLTKANEAIKTANELLDNTDGLTKTSVQAVRDALSALEALVANAPLPASEQETVDSLVEALNAAIKGVNPAADMDEITDKIHHIQDILDNDDLTDEERQHIEDELDKIKDAAGYNEETGKAEADLSVDEAAPILDLINGLNDYLSKIASSNSCMKNLDGFLNWLFQLIYLVIELVRNVA